MTGAATRGTAAVLAALLAGSCHPQRPAEPASVILVVIDTLRADHLGCYGYDRPTSPRLDEVARRGTRLAAARSASSWTLPSVASILTGVYPAVHGAERSDAVLSDGLSTMAEDFHDAGFATAALSANPAFVTPQQGLARGFDVFEVLQGETVGKRTLGAVPADASLSRWVREATAEDVTDRALEWLAARDTARPFFLYVHYFDPHAAYTPPAELAARFGVAPGEPLAGDAQWDVVLAPEAPGPEVLETLTALYDAEIAATDSAVGRLFDGLGDALPERVLVAVTSDHGEEFGDHGSLQHGRTLYDELLRVPLLVAGPRVPGGRVVDAPVSLAGLRATLTEAAGIEGRDGTDIEPSFLPLLLHGEAGGQAVYADLDARFDGDRQLHRRAVVEGTNKLLLSPSRTTELFDLAADPGEHHDLSGRDREARVRLQSRVRERDARAAARRAAAPPGRGVLDAAMREKLKALGYLQ